MSISSWYPIKTTKFQVFEYLEGVWILRCKMEANRKKRNENAKVTLKEVDQKNQSMLAKKLRKAELFRQTLQHAWTESQGTNCDIQRAPWRCDRRHCSLEDLDKPLAFVITYHKLKFVEIFKTFILMYILRYT